MVVEPDFIYTFKKLAKHAVETKTCSHSVIECFLVTTYNRLLQCTRTAGCAFSGIS